MPRIRYVKPGLFSNEVLGQMTAHARLLFIGLWCHADREGRLEDRPARLKAELFPYDEIDVDELLTALHRKKFVRRYRIGKSRYIQINKFLDHQKPHYKEPPSLIPAPDGHVDSLYIVGAVPEPVRQEIFERDGRQCVLCHSTDKLSIDHIKPRSLGGTNDKDNLRTLCMSCNASKRNQDASLTAG